LYRLVLRWPLRSSSTPWSLSPSRCGSRNALRPPRAH